MPSYRFECQECVKEFVLDLSMIEYAAMQKEKNSTCPECGSKKVVRVFSAPAVIRASGGSSSAGDCGPGCFCG